MKHNFLTILLLITSFFGCSQQKITWDDLKSVEFEEKYFPGYEDNFLAPKFPSSIKLLEGKKITLEGFFFHFNTSDKKRYNFISLDEFYTVNKLSTEQFSASIIQLELNKTPDYENDDIIIATGTLTLNYSNPEHMIYILKDCEVELLNQNKK